MREDIAARFTLESWLSTLGLNALEHRLHTLRVSTGDDDESTEFAIDIATTNRPVIAQSPLDGGWSGPVFSLEPHGFTLRLGRFLQRAFVALALEPIELAPRSDSLGSALAESMSDGQLSGCAALSSLVCQDILSPPACLQTACTQAALTLDEHLSAWWRAYAADGIEFTMAGALLAHDDDGDREIEAVSAADNGSWTGAATLESGAVIELPGELPGERPGTL